MDAATIFEAVKNLPDDQFLLLLDYLTTEAPERKERLIKQLEKQIK